MSLKQRWLRLIQQALYSLTFILFASPTLIAPSGSSLCEVNLLMFLGIDLENIVYYKDNTHYFVMTAKKQSLLDKGVIINVSMQTHSEYK